jgi:VIT1/CCC1 family predicted Fe2+/Mn2+ transporter
MTPEIENRSTEIHRATSEHLGKHRQYWRDIILGVNDGLVSTFLLVVGVSGGGLSVNDILLTAIAGALAGAVSMMAGEFVATKAQNDVLSGELALETNHVNDYPQEEVRELGDLLPLIGVTEDSAELRENLLAFYESNPVALLKIMKALEFGVVDEERRSPRRAAFMSGLLFMMGSLPSVLPYTFVHDAATGLIIASVATVVSLAIVGGVKTWATRGKFIVSVTENLVVSCVGGAIAYGVGVLFDKVVH